MMRRTAAAALWAIMLAPVGLLLVWACAWRWPWPALWPHEWRVRAWYDLGDSIGLGAVALRSIGIATAVAFCATVLGLVTSRSIARARRHGALYVLLHLPFAMSPVVLGVSLEYVFLRVGIAGHVLGVVCAQGLLAYAYAATLLSGFWNARTLAHADGAATLGANSLQVWIYVLLPIARPLLVLCLAQTFLISWFDFAIVLLIGEARVTTLTTDLYQFVVSGDQRLAAASALLLLLPPVAALVAHRHLQNGAPIGAAEV